ncbi:calcium-binding protein [Phenylobacterium sp.]|uniref:calcium-binding protein n=1 Tax=Phenylobacterium sp. TaxID=1871053 RepID=UPI0035B03716
MTTVTISQGASISDLNSVNLNTASVLTANSNTITVASGVFGLTINGSFQYDAYGDLTTNGSITGIHVTINGAPAVDITDFNSSISTWASASDYVVVAQSLYGGADLMHGSSGADSFAGYGGYDTIYGGAGNDTIDGGAGDSFLRGEDGNDSIIGGVNFDYINGNAGADTVSGGDGVDWVVGGKDADIVHGDAGNDVVNGNMGNDTVYGDDGDDWVRGGQDNDSISGGAGNDWISGDKGDDTISGGTGADVFHSFAGAGIDRIVDFSLAEGDHILLDAGTTYTVAQSGADTVITLDGGGEVILVGVTMSSLTGDWISVA